MIGDVDIKVSEPYSFPIDKGHIEISIPEIFNNERSREDLNDYLKDFLETIGADITFQLYPFRQYVLVHLCLFEDHYGMQLDRGLMFKIPYMRLAKMDVPTLGSYIFIVWNAYVELLAGAYAVTERGYYVPDYNLTEC